MAMGLSPRAIHQTSQKSREDEPRVLSSQSFLEEEDSGPQAQQPQATSSRGSGPLSDRDLSHGSLVKLEYLPFFRTYGQLLTEELTQQLEVCRDQGRDWSIREAPFLEDSEPPDGFFPYCRSKEENFPRLSCGGSQDPPTRKEAWAGCFRRTTVSSGSSAAYAGPVLVSGSSPACCPVLPVSAGHSHDGAGQGTPFSSDAAFSGHSLCASGFVPYYRTPEEGLHTSPGPPVPPGDQEPAGELPRPGAATQ